MTTSIIARKVNAGAWQPRTSAGWLGLAASPTFAMMAWISASPAPQTMICSPESAVPPIGGMALMYLLMSLFHLPPWLKLASRRAAECPSNPTEGD